MANRKGGLTVVPNDEKRESKTPILAQAIEEASKPLLARFEGRKPGAWITDEQKEALIDLLAMHQGQIREVARLTGVSQAQVFDVKHENEAAFVEKRERFKRMAMVEAQEVFVEATAQVRSKLSEASARDAAVIAGIYAEKSALFAGEGSTVTHKVIQTVDVAALDAAMERLKAIQATRTEQQGETLEADFKVIE